MNSIYKWAEEQEQQDRVVMNQKSKIRQFIDGLGFQCESADCEALRCKYAGEWHMNGCTYSCALDVISAVDRDVVSE